MVQIRKSVIFAALVLLVCLSACTVGKWETYPPATAESLASGGPILVDQPVTVIENPVPENLLSCSVTEGLPNVNGWVKFEDEFYWFSDLFERDEEGRVWVVTGGHGNLMYDGDEWHVWNSEERDDMSGGWFTSMAVSPTHLYVKDSSGSGDETLMILDIERDHWETINSTKILLLVDLAQYRFQAVAFGTNKVSIDLSSQLWQEIPEGIDIIVIDTHEDRFQLYSSKEDFLVFDIDEEYWVSYRDGTNLLAFDIEGNQWREVEVTANQITIELDDYAWRKISENFDLSIFNLETLNYVDFSDTPIENKTDEYFSANQWQTLSAVVNTIKGDVKGGLAISPTGQVYVMTNEGLEVFENGDWSLIEGPPLEQSHGYASGGGLFDHEGNYWVYSSQGVWKFDGIDWTQYSVSNGNLPSDKITVINMDNDGRIWVGTDVGIAVFSNDNWYYFSPEDYPWYEGDVGFIRNIVFDDQNRAWVTVNKALSIYNGDEVIVFTKEFVDIHHWQDMIGFDADGCTWVGLSLGMIVYQGELDMAPGDFSFLDN